MSLKLLLNVVRTTLLIHFAALVLDADKTHAETGILAAVQAAYSSSMPAQLLSQQSNFYVCLEQGYLDNAYSMMSDEYKECYGSIFFNASLKAYVGKAVQLDSIMWRPRGVPCREGEAYLNLSQFSLADKGQQYRGYVVSEWRLVDGLWKCDVVGLPSGFRPLWEKVSRWRNDAGAPVLMDHNDEECRDAIIINEEK